MKKNKSEGFWPRLTNEDKKFQHISVDWNRYVDEDEEDEAKEVGGPGWDPEQMNKFDQGEDSDDEEGNIEDLDQDAEKQDQEGEIKEGQKKKEEEEKKEE